MSGDDGAHLDGQGSVGEVIENAFVSSGGGLSSWGSSSSASSVGVEQDGPGGGASACSDLEISTGNTHVVALVDDPDSGSKTHVGNGGCGSGVDSCCAVGGAGVVSPGHTTEGGGSASSKSGNLRIESNQDTSWVDSSA